MNILPINLIRTVNIQKKPEYNNTKTNQLNFDKVSFTQKPRQTLDKNTFFIRMDSYEQNENWAKSMNKLCQKVSKLVENKKDFNEIVKTTSKGVKNTYWNLLYENNQLYKMDKSKRFVIERFADKYGRLKDGNSVIYYCFNSLSRGKEYFKKYAKECQKHKNNEYKTKSNEEYSDARTTRIKLDSKQNVRIYYAGAPNSWTQNIEVASRAYKKLIETNDPSVEDIVSTAATIQWLLAQSTSFESGSDSIANVISKSILHAYNVKISPAKEGVSFDFEAFYRDLDEYIKIYPNLFEEKPKFI